MKGKTYRLPAAVASNPRLARAYAQKIADRLGRTVLLKRDGARSRRNPVDAWPPAQGSVWRCPRARLFTIRSVDLSGDRVALLDRELGTRVWVDGMEFRATYKPHRPAALNPERPTADLPPTWLWTRQGYGQQRALYAARDTRWEPSVPDLVSTSRADVIRQAREIDRYGPHGRKGNPKRRNPAGEYHRRGPTVGSFWRHLGAPGYVARVAKTERAKGGMPPMVVLEIVVPGEGLLRHIPLVVGTTRLPVNEFYAKHEATRPTGQNPQRKPPAQLYDALGNGITVGAVLIGTGLQNAGRAYTVLAIGTGGRVRLQEHLTSRDFWTFARHYRVDTAQNPRREPSRVREHGTHVTASASPEQRLAALRRIVAERQYAKIDGVMVDGFTASAIVQVYDAINDVNKAKYIALPVQRMAAIAWKLMEKNPRAPFREGERVSVPYMGRTSYFGRRTKRTREKATVQGVDPDGSIHVTIQRGKGTETHHFTPAEVRHLPGQRAASGAAQLDRMKNKLRTIAARADRDAALAAAGEAERETECETALAQLAVPAFGEKPSPDYTRHRSRMRRAQLAAAANREIAGELERQDPDYADPWAELEAVAASNPPPREFPSGLTTEQDLLTAGYVPCPACGGAGIETPEFNTGPVCRVCQGQGWVWGGGVKAHNPSRASQRARAAQTFEKWHEFAPKRVTRMKGPPRTIPRTLVKLGDVTRINYKSNKFTGRQTEYTHKTEHPRPVLATDPDARHVYLVGGKMKVTADGLVN